MLSVFTCLFNAVSMVSLGVGTRIDERWAINVLLYFFGSMTINVLLNMEMRLRNDERQRWNSVVSLSLAKTSF